MSPDHWHGGTTATPETAPSLAQCQIVGKSCVLQVRRAVGSAIIGLRRSSIAHHRRSWRASIRARGSRATPLEGRKASTSQHRPLIQWCFFHRISIEDDDLFDLGCHREQLRKSSMPTRGFHAAVSIFGGYASRNRECVVCSRGECRRCKLLV